MTTLENTVKYNIKTFGDSILKKKSLPIPEITDEIKKLADSMLNTMYEARGIGLAAEQIGRTESICVIDVPEDMYDRETAKLNEHVVMPMILINPKLSEQEGAVRQKEGCLSFPGLYIEITRPRSLLVSYIGIDGKSYAVRVHGLLARAVEHEVDHLNGVLLSDKLSASQKIVCARKLHKLRAETLKNITVD